MTETPIDVAPVSVRFAALREAVGSVVVGQELVLRQLFVTLLCSSHALVEGVPGVAKTLLVKTLAATLGIRFGRVQFTPRPRTPHPRRPGRPRRRPGNTRSSASRPAPRARSGKTPRTI